MVVCSSKKYEEEQERNDSRNSKPLHQLFLVTHRVMAAITYEFLKQTFMSVL